MSNFKLITIIILVIKSISKLQTSNQIFNADVKLMQQQLLDAQSNAQIKNLYTIGVKMLKRMQIQNDQNSINLDECYERLGKYTRLMVVNNKRRALTNIKNAKDLSLNTNETPDLINSFTNLVNSKTNDPQASFSLLNEINFYL